MEAGEIMDGWIQHAEESDLRDSVKDDVLVGLRFFRDQVGKARDRRMTGAELTMRWRRVEELAKGTTFGGQLTRDLKLRVVFQELGIAVSEIVAGSYDRWDADHFFRYLRGHVRWPPHMSKRERTFAEMSLKYLEVEASRARAHRDLDSIQRAWSEVKPLVGRSGLLSQFNRSTNLRARVHFFLTGRLA